MKIKVSEATNVQLDLLVAKAVGIEVKRGNSGALYTINGYTINGYSPTQYWAQGGPIIEREKIDVVYQPQHKQEPWHAAGTADKTGNGHTPLIAAMRCYVTSKLGGEVEVEVPDELT